MPYSHLASLLLKTSSYINGQFLSSAENNAQGSSNIKSVVFLVENLANQTMPHIFHIYLSFISLRDQSRRFFIYFSTVFT
jgi:hypothetical protein